MLDRVSAAVEIEAPARPDKAAPTIRVGDQTILVGDCAIALARMPEGSVDVVVTSPPYNIGLRYNSYDDGGDRGALSRLAARDRPAS